VDKNKLRALLKYPPLRDVGKLLNRNQLRIMTGLLPGYCHLKNIYLNWG
jgi:hypothetical protein